MDRFILQFPNPCLSTVSTPVLNLHDIKEIADKMLTIAYSIRSEIYHYPRGFEVAAPQIGELYRIILLQGKFEDDPRKIDSSFIINPEVIEESGFFYNWEDCLSVKNMRACVKRCNKIKIKYIDINGNEIIKVFLGNDACDIQHGIDHLNGKMFFERDMKYLIPENIYRQLKDNGVEYLNDFVNTNYNIFDINQNFSIKDMEILDLIHPRQCLEANK